MGTTVAGVISPSDVQNMQTQSQAIGSLGIGGAANGKFNFFAAFDGTNNDRNNVALSGNPFQTNVANLFDQAFEASQANSNIAARYYPGVGTGGENGNVFNAAFTPTSVIYEIAEKAYTEFRSSALDYLDQHRDATPDNLTASIVGFSRVPTPAVHFSSSLALMEPGITKIGTEGKE